MTKREGIGEDDGIAIRPRLVQHRRDRAGIPGVVHELGAQTCPQPDRQRRPRMQRSKRTSLEPEDLLALDLRAVLVAPDPAEPERGNRREALVTHRGAE